MTIHENLTFYRDFQSVFMVIKFTSVNFATVYYYYYEVHIYLAGHRLAVSGIFSRLLAMGCTRRTASN